MPLRILLLLLALSCGQTSLVLAQGVSHGGGQVVSKNIVQPAVQAKPREMEVTFRSGDVTLAGTLLLPESSAPVAAIVLTHGSGAATREQGRPFAERFVRDGMAALIFDKRGCGSSGGQWYAASLDDLADDAIAAAAFLKSRPEVDGKRVGLWGVSQAGWVNPHAIARAPGVFSFAVVVSGGGVKPIDVERYDYNAALEHIQATPEEKREANALVAQYFEYLRTGEGREALLAAVAAAASKPWSKAVNFSRVMPSAAARVKWEWVPTYDPEIDITKITIPMLVVLGSRDRPFQAAHAEELWRQSLVKAGNSDATVVVFIAGGHGITLGEHHLYKEGQNTYAPGYFELVDSWLRLHGATAQ